MQVRACSGPAPPALSAAPPPVANPPYRRRCGRSRCTHDFSTGGGVSLRVDGGAGTAQRRRLGRSTPMAVDAKPQDPQW